MILKECVYASQEGRLLWDIFVSLSDFKWEDAMEQAKAWKVKSEHAPLQGARGVITARMVAERMKENLDAEGNCKLKDEEKWAGKCLTSADVKYLVGKALGLKNPRYVRPIIYEAWRQGLITDKRLESLPGYTADDKLREEATWEPIHLEAVIWAPGEHHPSLNGDPCTLIVTEEDVREAYPRFRELAEDQGIPVDVDHLKAEDSTLLQDLGYDEVARITRVALRDGKILATEIQPVHESFYTLLREGLVKAFSVYMDAEVESVGDGVYRVTGVNSLESVSLVKNPACRQCTVQRIYAARADDTRHILEVKMRFGGDTLADPGTQEPGQVPGQEQGQDLAMELEGLLSRLEKVAEKLEALLNPGEEDGGEDEPAIEAENLKTEVEAMKRKLLENEARELVESYAEEGKILPKDVERHMKLALSNPTEYRELMDDAPVIIEMSRKSAAVKQAKEEKKPSYQEFLKELERIGWR